MASSKMKDGKGGAKKPPMERHSRSTQDVQVSRDSALKDYQNDLRTTLPTLANRSETTASADRRHSSSARHHQYSTVPNPMHQGFEGFNSPLPESGRVAASNSQYGNTSYGSSSTHYPGSDISSYVAGFDPFSYDSRFNPPPLIPASNSSFLHGIVLPSGLQDSELHPEEQLHPYDTTRSLADPHEQACQSQQNPVSDPKQRCHCPEKGCTATFSRKADVARHVRSTHFRQLMDCPKSRCSRVGNNGFARIDHLKEHLRGYHGDVGDPKRRSKRDRN